MSEELVRVLLVDDDTDIRTVATMALEMVGGFTVRSCGSGAEALDALSEFSPQMILLDVMMPGMSGPELLARLRVAPQTLHIPVAFLTATKAQPEEMDKLLKLGAVEVLAKPFDPMLLSDQVRAIWGRIRPQ